MPYSSISELPDNIKEKPERAQRQWMAVWNSAYAACMAKEGSNTSNCESGAFARANGVIKGAELSESEDYRTVAASELSFDQIREFLNSALLQGRPDGYSCWVRDVYDDYCIVSEEGKLYKRAYVITDAGAVLGSPVSVIEHRAYIPVSADSITMYGEMPNFRVFVETSTLEGEGKDFSKPQWIPFLPKPGLFKHPAYGEIEITLEGNQALVDSVKQNVYQKNIPLDAEHQTKLSGAVGWIKDMRLNEDSSGDAYVEWTERGQTLLKGGGFKYVSPQFGSWSDPATGVVHDNVVIGGAITTRPFFKEGVLRALVASEAGTQIIQSDKEDKNVPDPKTTLESAGPLTPAPAPVTTYTTAEVDGKIQEATRIFTEQVGDLTIKLGEATTTAASEKAAREALEGKLAEMQKTARQKQFTDLVAGRGGASDGAPWAGDAEKHVEFLEKLAEQFGEDNAIVTGYIEQQNAVAQQLAQSDAFKELGSSAGRGPSDPEKRLDALTKSHQVAHPTLSFAEAQSEVLGTPEGARLYEGKV